MANVVGEKLINFKVYNDNQELLGLADVELPTLEATSETISGAGIAGEVDSPTLGHYGAMSMTLKWRVTERQALGLLAPKAHAIELRGSIQRWNAALGTYETQALKVVTRAVPKSSPLGSLAPGAAQEPSAEFSVRYLKVFLAGRPYCEIDPLNYICVIDGVDYLASVRADLGA
jgi:P2 family phage contractile tail tube protein